MTTRESPGRLEHLGVPDEIYHGMVAVVEFARRHPATTVVVGHRNPDLDCLAAARLFEVLTGVPLKFAAGDGKCPGINFRLPQHGPGCAILPVTQIPPGARLVLVDCGSPFDFHVGVPQDLGTTTLAVVDNHVGRGAPQASMAPWQAENFCSSALMMLALMRTQLGDNVLHWISRHGRDATLVRHALALAYLGGFTDTGGGLRATGFDRAQLRWLKHRGYAQGPLYQDFARSPFWGTVQDLAWRARRDGERLGAGLFMHIGRLDQGSRDAMGAACDQLLGNFPAVVMTAEMDGHVVVSARRMARRQTVPMRRLLAGMPSGSWSAHPSDEVAGGTVRDSSRGAAVAAIRSGFVRAMRGTKAAQLGPHQGRRNLSPGTTSRQLAKVAVA